ncbi:MATE efflux family protein [Xylanimonas cellulosilytica DSM 15894]|uniref:MATE efflux family protein n=1 Tax=Xylanimonas cellulosilytica (strain DSM 15894 / JCM 12276 / CECT 5975 / KCTC 9989 / LMG 20990 / NBRC 107835 / XIL07) TaxID=446471 RepID=D1BRT4_XYLCX|nr:MATE family efflux transporter [Xylanimonas cellulosilytica]ACZ32350.1 MATE efflux family protein [Xylanimonas cellulosilytica DSM 15894]
MRRSTGRIDREILALAVPALGALVAEPLFVLVDSAVVGHLGTPQLAGLSLASNLLVLLVGLCVFLAYATTASVARLTGAGREREALQSGVDGMWLALLVGAVLATALWLAAPWATSALGGTGETAQHAVTYLRWSAPGLPGMLLVLAATGVLRGLKDTRTPLVVASTGAVVNAVLNVSLVYGAGLGIMGSALGTALTQIGMGVTLVVVVVRGARRRGASLRPAAGGIWANAAAGAPLLVRTASLRLAILLTVAVATRLGDVTLAGYQVVASLWGLAAFTLDALAIAAQALVGHGLGAGDVGRVRTVLRRCLRWGVTAGAVIGVVLAAAGWWIAPLFTSDDAVRAAVAAGLVVCGLLMPMAGYVFVLDGVLIGAGDGRYLAAVGMLTLVVYAPFAVAVGVWAPSGAAGLAWLWAAFAGVFMFTRALTTGLRARGTRWLVTGV